MTIVHITTREAWQAAQAQGSYRAPSLESEGYIHCSTPAQVVDTANRFFAGQRGLVLLCIDSPRLLVPLLYEPPAEDPASPERFPHLYGPLNLDAVTSAIDFAPGQDG